MADPFPPSEARERRVGAWISGVAHAGLIVSVALAGAIFRPPQAPAIRMAPVETMSSVEFEAMAAASRGAGPLGDEASATPAQPQPPSDEVVVGGPVAMAPPALNPDPTALPAPDAESEAAPNLSDVQTPQMPVAVATVAPSPQLPTTVADETPTETELAALAPAQRAPAAPALDQPAPAAPDAPQTSQPAPEPEPISELALATSDAPGSASEARERRAERIAAAEAAAQQQAAAEAAARAEAERAAAEAAAEEASRAQAEARAREEAERQAALEDQARAAEDARQQAEADARAEEARLQAEADAAREAEIRRAEEERIAEDQRRRAEEQAAADAAEALAQAEQEAERARAEAEAREQAEVAREAPDEPDALTLALQEAMDTPPEGAGSEGGGGRAETGPPLTRGEQEGLRLEIEACWNIGSLSREAQRISVTVEFAMTPDGMPEEDSIEMLDFSGGSEAAAAQAFEAARRAILRCALQQDGYQLPAEKYSRWQTTVIEFHPQGGSSIR